MKCYLLTTAEVPNPWAAAHFWVVAYLEWGSMSNRSAFMHMQVDLSKQWPGALAYMHAAQLVQEELCAHVCVC